MKIAVCMAQVPFVKGGAEFLSDNLYKELVARNYEVEYIKIPFKWYPPQEIVNNAMLWRLLDLTESDGKKIDGVITTKFPSYVLRHPEKITWLYHQHRPAYDLAFSPYDDLAPHGAWGEIVRRKLASIDGMSLREAKKVFSISRNVSDRLEKYNNISSEVLYPPPPFNGRYFCRNFDNYILYPSRLDPKKRQELVIKSMKYVKADLTLRIVGTGPHLASLKEAARESRVEDKVEFTGFVPENELLELYADALCVAYTPLDEDLGYVSMEGVLSKKPIITCSDSGGSLEFIEHGSTGYIVDPDPEQIAMAIDRIYSSGSARAMGEAGFRKFGGTILPWDAVIQKLLKPLS